MQSKKSNPKEKSRFYFILATAGQTTILLVGPVLAGLLLGLYIDNTAHTSPLFLIIGVVLGFVASIYNIYKLMKIMK